MSFAELQRTITVNDAALTPLFHIDCLQSLDQLAH